MTFYLKHSWDLSSSYEGNRVKGERHGEIIHTHYCGRKDKQQWKNDEHPNEDLTICWRCGLLECFHYPWYWLVECVNGLIWLVNEWVNLMWQIIVGTVLLGMMFPPLGMVFGGVYVMKVAEFFY